MATSGSTDLATSRDEIITEAMEHMGVLGEGQSPTAAQLTSMSRTLNWLVKHIQVVHGGNLFSRQKWYVFPKKNQHKYSLAQGSADKFCRDLDFINTFVATAAAAAATTVTVDDDTGIADGDVIGVEVESRVVHWTTVNGTPSANVITITTGLPSAAAVDGQVYTYTDSSASGDRFMPLLVEEAYRRNAFVASDGSQGTDTPITLIERNDYMELNAKSADGAINQIWYNRQRMFGDLYTWPEADDEREFMVLWVQRALEDMDSADQEPDYPQEWFITLAYQLAMYSVTKFAVDNNKANTIFALAESTLKDALASDTAMYMRFQPADETNWG